MKKFEVKFPPVLPDDGDKIINVIAEDFAKVITITKEKYPAHYKKIKSIREIPHVITLTQ